MQLQREDIYNMRAYCGQASRQKVQELTLQRNPEKIFQDKNWRG
jgi:hypothetical protein